MPKQKHILVIRLSAMGDVAISVPVLRAFMLQNSKVKLTVLTRPFFAPLFKGLPNVSVFKVDLKGKHKGVLGVYKLSKELKALEITEVADLHNVLRTNILKCFFLGKTFKQIDKGRKEKKALVNGKQFKQLKTSHERYADVFRKLGFKLDLSKLEYPKPEAFPLLFSILKIDITKPLIGIAPFAQYESKMYPLDKIAEVIKFLSQDYNVLLFGGGNKEKEQLSLFEKNNANVYNMVGEFTFKDELAIISNLKLMLSMDSGNGHLAAMFGVKVVTIWGNTHPFSGFTPFNQPIEHQLIPNRENFPLIPTSIYGNKYPENYKTVAGTISPITVLEKIKSLI
ncbi:glycosyltransferase family 9 protein [Aurantibacter sp.]|uniref:glycosyltransferase family 9 protein n=1 Tax=Aurantibacter sp. TaxID=2807103 RepID=UPI0035C86CE6